MEDAQAGYTSKITVWNSTVWKNTVQRNIVWIKGNPWKSGKIGEKNGGDRFKKSVEKWMKKIGDGGDLLGALRFWQG